MLFNNSIYQSLAHTQRGAGHEYKILLTYMHIRLMYSTYAVILKFLQAPAAGNTWINLNRDRRSKILYLGSWGIYT